MQSINIDAKSKSNIDNYSPILTHTRSNNSTLDMAYLYADPLLIEVQTTTKKLLVDFNKPLEID
jgi:hypothetical protein